MNIVETPISDGERKMINHYYENFITQSFRKLRYTSSETSVQFILQLSLAFWHFKWGPLLTQEKIEGKLNEKYKENL